MTTRALIKSSHRDFDLARSALVEHATAATGRFAGRPARVVVEPLLRRDSDGSRRQAVRIQVDGIGADLHPGDIVAHTGSGQSLATEAVAGPAGSIRLLIPAVESPTTIDFSLRAGSGEGELRVLVTPQREWTIHLVHHSHLDIGYTDPQGTVLAEHVAFLDSCLDLTRTTDGWPDDAQFRWAVESLWSFDQWRRARPPQRVAEFIDRVRDGHIELTALPYNLHTDTCSTDELHELLRLAREVSTTYGVRFISAMQTDVPGAVAGLPDALARFGVRYLSVAHNWAGRSVPHLKGGANLPRLFRWRAPSGAEVLVWSTDSPHGLAYMEGPMLGFDTSYEMVDDLLPAYLTSLAVNPYPFPGHILGWSLPAEAGARDPYPWDVVHLRVQGHFGDNAPPRLIMAETVRRWNETWEYPRLRMSRNEDFFADAESRLGDAIETFEGDWGDWWVEGTGAGARPQALTRHAQAVVTDAQTVDTMATLSGAPPSPDSADRSRSAYEWISLFNEHTWGAAEPWTDGDQGMQSGDQQWHWKYATALHASDTADEYLDQAAARFGAVLPARAGALATFYAVNTAGWARSGIVSLFLRESLAPFGLDVAVYDGRTGARLQVEESEQVNPLHRNSGRFLRVQVHDVPACGTVRLDVLGVEPDQDGDADAALTPEPTVLENRHLRVRVDLARSSIASVVELASGRELVNQESTVGFNGYVYDTYTMAGGNSLASNLVTVSDQLELLASRSLARPAALIERVSTAVEERLVYEFGAEGVRWGRVTLRLPHDSPVLFIENRLSKPATATKESACLAFPFAVDDPAVRYEISGAVTGTGLDHVPGAPQHMRAVRAWVSFDAASGAVAWATRDAPLVQPEVIALPYAPFPDSTAPREPGTVYSWVHNNIWDTNFPPEQGFETSFRYAVGVTPAGAGWSTPSLATRTATDLTNPLIGVLASGTGEADTAEHSLLAVDDDRVRLVSATIADDGSGDVTVRLQSYADEPIRVQVTPGFDVAGAWESTYLGDREGELAVAGGAVEVVMPRLGTTAVRLSLSP